MFNYFIKKLAIILFCLLMPFSALAYDNTANGWQVEIAPYLWAINMNGRVQVGPYKLHVKENFSDLLQDLQWGGMIWLDAKNGPWGLFFNGLYTSLGQSEYMGSLKLNASDQFSLLSAGLSYQLYQHMNISIDPYLGARLTVNKASLSAQLAGYKTSYSNNQHWLDPILGARINYQMTYAWLATAAADIGGTNFNTDKSYNLIALIGYRPQTIWKNTTWYAGYRLLYQHYATGHDLKKFDWSMKLFGPLVGVTIKL
jgi:hypothetical protein